MERAKKPSAIPVSPVIPTPQVSISEDSSFVSASLPTGESIQVLLYGATVTSWKSATGKENLFLSSKAILDGSKGVRGGVPIVFPNFGPAPQAHATTGLPQHGFARDTKWEYLGKSSSESATLPNSKGDSSVKLDFGLSNAMLAENLPSEWKNYQFGITYSVTLGKETLETALAIRNTGEKEIEFQTLLHTYFAIDDISKTNVSGLEQAAYFDKVAKEQQKATGAAIDFTQETDRVYSSPASQVITIQEGGKPRFEISRDSLDEVVVWNPWDQKAKGMSDFGPDGAWKQMVCVEAGSVGSWNKLEAGDTWEGAQRIKAF